MADEELDRVLERVDPAKRAFLKTIIVGTAFVVPTVASFSMDGLSLYEANAQVSNLG
jgi:Na+/H+-dicarboxylate symporter